MNTTFDGSPEAEHPLYKTSGCQSLIVWMRRKDHESGVLKLEMAQAAAARLLHARKELATHCIDKKP